MSSMVQHFFRSRSRISERIVGEPVRIGGRTLRPVVRVRGWRSTGDSASGGGAGARLRVVPESVVVVESDGREYRVPARDNSRFVLWGLAGAALLVVVASRSVKAAVR